MSIVDCISEIVSSSEDLFETDQTLVMKSILFSEKIVFLDTCFITRSHNMQAEDLLNVFERMAGGTEAERVVFVVTGLVLYELKDSSKNVLQQRNKAFFEKMVAYGFRIVLLQEEAVCENLRPYMNYPIKKWNEIFIRILHDNVANFLFIKLVKTDNRMPYYGCADFGFSVPDDRALIKDIIIYLKNAKTKGDSLAEELIGISLLCILILTNGSARNEYVFCTHDFGAIARLNKAMQTSYPNMQKQFKTIHMFSMVQYMVKERIYTGKDDVTYILQKIMGNSVKLIVREDLPFSPVEKTISIEEAVEMIFNDESVELVAKG